MGSVLSMICEYRMLAAKAEQLGIPLDEVEAARMVGLAKLLSGELPDADVRRRMPRLPFPSRVQLTVLGGFASAEVINLSGGGLAVQVRGTIAFAAHTIVRIAEPSEAMEYVFPCRIAWQVREGAAMRVGFAFDGMPTAEPLYPSRSRGIWSGSIRFADDLDPALEHDTESAA